MKHTTSICAARLVALTAQRNIEDGANLEEADDGDLTVRAVDSILTDNGEAGIQVEQSDDGDGVLWLINVAFANNGDGPFDAGGVDTVNTVP